MVSPWTTEDLAVHSAAALLEAALGLLDSAASQTAEAGGRALEVLHDLHAELGRAEQHAAELLRSLTGDGAAQLPALAGQLTALKDELEGIGTATAAVRSEHLHLAADAGSGVEELVAFAGEVAEREQGELAVRTEVEEALEQLTATLGEQQAQYTDAQAEVEAGLDGLAEDVSTRHGPAAGQAFAALAADLTEALRGRVERIFGHLEQTLDGSFAALYQHAEEHGGAWSQAAAGLLGGISQHVGQEALRRVEQGIEHIIQHGVEALVSEVSEQAVTMSAGSAVTGILAPILPALAAVKAGAHLLNDILDMF